MDTKPADAGIPRDLFSRVAARMAEDLVAEHRFLLEQSSEFPLVPGDPQASAYNLHSLAFRRSMQQEQPWRMVWFQTLLCRVLHRDAGQGRTMIFVERPDSIMGDLVRWIWSYHHFALRVVEGTCGSGDIHVSAY